MFNIIKMVMLLKYTNYTNQIWKLQVRLTGGGIVIEHYWTAKRCDNHRGQVAISCLLVLVGLTPLCYLDEWFDLSIFQLFWRAEAMYVVLTIIIVMYLLIELSVFGIRWNAVVDLSVTQAHLCFVPNKLFRRHWQMPCRTWFFSCWGQSHLKNTYCADRNPSKFSHYIGGDGGWNHKNPTKDRTTKKLPIEIPRFLSAGS